MTDELPEGRPIPRAWRLAAGVVAAVLLVVGVGLLIARAAGFSLVSRSSASISARSRKLRTRRYVATSASALFSQNW